MIDEGVCFQERYIEENYSNTHYFHLKYEGDSYKVCISFCINGVHFKEQNPKCFLNNEEIIYFESLIYERRKNSFLLGRYSAKKAISRLSGEDNLKKILIKNGVFSQPVIVCESCSNLQVSLTHCDDIAAAVAFNDMFLLGIDVEKVNRNINHGVENELTNYEKELAKKIPYSYESSLLALWTIKESLSKVFKTGLTVPLYILEVKDIQICNDSLISTFTNFPQYCSISFSIYDYICSIVYPKNVEIDIDINKIRENLYKTLKISIFREV